MMRTAHPTSPKRYGAACRGWWLIFGCHVVLQLTDKWPLIPPHRRDDVAVLRAASEY